MLDIRRDTQAELVKMALADLYTFACLINPQYQYGEIHKKVFKWLQSNDIDQLLLLPRGHLKSHCMAVWCAWWLTKHPETTILYISATAELAEQQLYAIKNMISSDIYSRYWPLMLTPEEGKREKWSTTAFSVDHPDRKKENIRDHTCKTAGLTTNTTGWHADVVIADDVVVPDNAYTEEGRKRVAMAMSQITSILNPGGVSKACGTRYHPADIYDTWVNMKADVYDDMGNPVMDTEEGGVMQVPVWDILEEVVETDGFYLWPRSIRTDGKAFGFNAQILANIRAKYVDRTQYYAQYYNNPNDAESQRIDYSKFQYYDPKYLNYDGYSWYFKDIRLNTYAAVDFAYSTTEAADYTAIVVIGVASNGQYYVLDIARFKTDKIKRYYTEITRLHGHWKLRKLRAEVTAAQSLIVRDLKQKLKDEGIPLSIEDHRPTKKKEERIAAILEPRYENMLIWHHKGGYTSVLEEEVVQARPRHDDLKDALAAVIEMATPPNKNSRDSNRNKRPTARCRFGRI
jgi:predicted phage terminase large subunit-like protein